MNDIIDKLPKPLFLAIAGGIGCVLGSLLGELFMNDSNSLLIVLLETILWTTTLCFGLSLAIVLFQNILMGKKGISFKQIFVLSIGSSVAGILSGGLAQILYSILCFLTESLFLGELARVVAWTLLGGIMAFIMSFFIPNLNKIYAWLGGFLGGFAGVLVFIAIAFLIPIGYRQGGALALGFFIGLMVGLIEKVCREAWLTVVHSPRRFTQINLGERAVTIGSGNNDTVQTPDVPEGAVEYKLENGIIRCTQNQRTESLEPGHRQRIGKIDVVVCSPEHPYLGSLHLGENRSNGPAQPSVIKPPTQATNARLINQPKAPKEVPLPVTPPSGNDLTKKRRPIQLPPRKRS